MKKSVKIILIIVAVLLIGGGVFAYQVYQSVMGSEEITGSKSDVPESVNEIPPLTIGEADWPNWRGKNFDGKSNQQSLKTDWSNGLKKLWEVDFLCQGNATASWSTPVIVGNRVIVPGRDETSDLVFCLNAEDGSLIWKGQYKAEAGTSHGPGARATPFIDENRVYTFGRSGDLVCWQLLDGKKLWHKNVKEEGGVEPTWGFSTTPLIIDDKVIVQGGGNALVIAYDKMTGDVAWKSLQGEVGYSASVPLTIDSTENILVYHATALSCLNPADGKELWQVPWVADYNCNATTPAIEGDIIFHTTGYGKGGQALKVTGSGFKVLWTNETIASHHSDPFIIDGYIYGYSGQSTRNNGDFKCVELQTGKEIWSSDEIGYGTAIYVAGHIICLDLKGNLFLIKPETSGFKKIGELEEAIPEVKSKAWTAPVVANGKLYLRYLQRLICFDISK